MPAILVSENLTYCPNCRQHLDKVQPLNPLIWKPKANKRWLSATTLLIGLNVGVFLAMTVSGGSALFFDADRMLRWGADFGPLTFKGQYWRMIASSFLHFDFFHLIFNMLALWLVGWLLEEILGAVLLAGAYLLTSVGASVLSLSWHPMVVSAGASGAIFGLAGVLIAMLSYKKLRIFQTQLLRSRLISLVIYGLVLGLLPGADNMAHLGGLITGLVFGFFSVSLLRASSNLKMLAQTVLCRAKIAIEKKDYNSASMDLSAYVAYRPHDALGHALLGYSLHTLGRYTEAMDQYKRAIEIDPENQIVRANLAEIYVYHGEADAAVTLIANSDPAT